MARVLYSGVDEYGQPSEVMLGCAIGDIIPHFGTTAPPSTLVCDGSEVSREAYAELYEEIGSLCGQGDGSTTFNLPDLRGKWLMGADAERAAGEEVAEGLPNITAAFASRRTTVGENGSILFDNHAGNGNAFDVTPNGSDIGTSHLLQIGDEVPGTYLMDIVEMNASRASVVYGASPHVTPASVAVLPCIVYE